MKKDKEIAPVEIIIRNRVFGTASPDRPDGRWTARLEDTTGMGDTPQEALDNLIDALVESEIVEFAAARRRKQSE